MLNTRRTNSSTRDELKSDNDIMFCLLCGVIEMIICLLLLLSNINNNI